MLGRRMLRPYFDRAWYVAEHGRKWQIRRFPWWYHCLRGWKKGLSPHPLFDAAWYLAEHPDVARVRIDPVLHYVRHGWREGRSPHPAFDAPWYLDRNPDVAASGMEPLHHYLSYGWREGRAPHPAFDASKYLAEHADVARAGSEPLTHYLTVGWKEGRQPHALFDGAWYLQEYSDVAVSGIDPFTHFLAHGWREGREPTWRFSMNRYAASRERPLAETVNPFLHFLVMEYAAVADDPDAVESLLARYSNDDEGDSASATRRLVGASSEGHRQPGDVQAIAMYLPQFHRVPENDRWWGEGFTEWTNVRRARPMYEGHHQPHVPHPDIGYYDLDDPTVLERQATLAARYGIHGFCFYYYWFDGRRILEKPLDRMLRSGKPDFPFCFCWANENWTRTWDGLDREVLLEQRHSPDGDERFLRDLLPALRDPRYIRIDGRPLLAVYRPGLLDDAAATAGRWREIARREGLDGLHLAAVQSFDHADPRSFGFDSAIQFPPLQIPAANLARQDRLTFHEEFRGAVHDYRDAAQHALRVPKQRYPLFRGVMPGWDNTPRRMERGTSWVNASPECYGRWLRAAVEQTQREHPAGRQLIFINAWNEWAEGAHLEPDTRNGYRYLEETHAALQTAQGGQHGTALDATSGRHPSVWQERRARLESLFDGPLAGSSHECLTAHLALLSQLDAAGHHLFVEDGVPACRVEGEAFRLDGHEAFSKPHEKAWGNGRSRPFCFVLLQFGKPEVTARCVASIRRLRSEGRRIHVVVVDNASSAETVSKTKTLFAGMSDVTLLFNDRNFGFAVGNNIGYRHAREVVGADFIAVINNDTVIEDPDFIAKCLGLFGKWSYSVLGPDIVTPDGRHENPWNDFVYDIPAWRSLQGLFERQREAYVASGKAEFRRLGSRSPSARAILDPVLQGAAYIFSPVFTRERACPFDERTFLYGEEFLLAADCLSSGHLMLYSSELLIAHEEGASTATLPDDRKITRGYDGAIGAIAIARTRLERQAAASQGKCVSATDPGIATLTADGRRHVLLDLLFCQPGFHGGGEYGKAVFRAVVDSAARRGDVQVWVALDPRLFIDEWVWEACRRHAVNVVAVRSFDDVVSLVDDGHFDTFFAPAIVVYTGYEYMKRVGGEVRFKRGRTRVVGTLLDVRDHELAGEWERIATARKAAGCRRESSRTPRQWEAEASRQARHADELRAMYRRIGESDAIDTLVTISEYSAGSIRGRIGIRRPIEVLYPPEKPRASPEPFAHEGIDLEHDPFAVLVNAGREEKNAASVVAAFDRLFSDPAFAAEHPHLKLVLTGIGRLDDLGIAAPAHPQRFVAMPHLPSGRLEYLLARAAFLAYASFNEGFGYPPLEALSHGTPSIVADNTSVPEVCAAAAVLCNPFDVGSIAEGIRRILASPPSPEAMRSELARTSERQRRDMRRLADIVCGRVAAAGGAVPSSSRSLVERAA